MIILVSKRRVHGFQLPFFSCQKIVSFYFTSLGVQEELFQRSTTATLQRPGATFEFTGMFIAKPPTKKWTCDHVPFSEKNLLDPRTTNKKTPWFYMVFTPSPTWKTNQSAIQMAHGQLWDRSWPVGLDFRPGHKNILKQESLDATGWIIHQNCIWCISECCLMHLLNCLLYISDLLTYVPFIDSEHSKHCQLLEPLPLRHRPRVKKTISTSNFYSIWI